MAEFIPASQCITCVTQEHCAEKNCPCSTCHGGPGFQVHPNHLPESFYAMLQLEYGPNAPPTSKPEGDAT